MWFLEASAPALVLGSAQPDTSIDRGACERAGVEVVRRRSGGGAVLLEPGEALWVDVIVPAGDPLWDRDVGRASHWLGAVWLAALADSGRAGAAVHRGALVRTEWSSVICFAGLGPGEVTVGGRKVVGISQRRTRDAARFQCVALSVWDPAPIAALCAPPRPTAAELAPVAAGVGVPWPDLAAAFLANLPA